MEKEIRDRFKKMCEGYFDNVAKKLVIEHNVSLMQPCLTSVTQERRSASKIKTGEIMKHISALGKYSRIDSRHTRR